MKIERAQFAIELRADGRRLEGPAMRYGETSAPLADLGGRRERFEAGAFAADLQSRRVRWLNYRHDVSRLLVWTGAGLEIRDDVDALNMAATLPGTPLADLVLREVREGEITGLSVEFHAESERDHNGLRIVERARLIGIGVVPNPAYRQSRIEARSEGGIIRLDHADRQQAEPPETPPRSENRRPLPWL